MAIITVHKQNIDVFGTRFTVTVTEEGSSTTHNVIVAMKDRLRLCPKGTAEFLVEKTFEFLLEHEPKEAILKEFGLMEVARYFPGFDEDIARRCGEGA